MGATPKLAIPYVDSSFDLNHFPVDDQAQADQVEAVILPGAWVTVTASAPGTLRYRLVGGLVYLDASLTLTTTSGTIYTLTTTPLPANVRPGGFTARGFCDFNGWPGGINIGQDGVVQCRHNSGANRANVNGQICYTPV